MDPNELLRRLREIVAEYYAGDKSAHATAQEMVYEFESLDEWLTNGGFLPTDWIHEENRR